MTMVAPLCDDGRVQQLDVHLQGERSRVLRLVDEHAVDQRDAADVGTEAVQPRPDGVGGVVLGADDQHVAGCRLAAVGPPAATSR